MSKKICKFISSILIAGGLLLSNTLNTCASSNAQNYEIAETFFAPIPDSSQHIVSPFQNIPPVSSTNIPQDFPYPNNNQHDIIHIPPTYTIPHHDVTYGHPCIVCNGIICPIFNYQNNQYFMYNNTCYLIDQFH